MGEQLAHDDSLPSVIRIVGLGALQFDGWPRQRGECFLAAAWVEVIDHVLSCAWSSARRILCLLEAGCPVARGFAHPLAGSACLSSLAALLTLVASAALLFSGQEMARTSEACEAGRTDAETSVSKK